MLNNIFNINNQYNFVIKSNINQKILLMEILIL